LTNKVVYINGTLTVNIVTVCTSMLSDVESHGCESVSVYVDKCSVADRSSWSVSLASWALPQPLIGRDCHPMRLHCRRLHRCVYILHHHYLAPAGSLFFTFLQSHTSY